MNVELTSLIIGVAGTALGIALTIYYARRAAAKRKLLTFEAERSRLPLTSERSLVDYNISIVYRPREGEEEQIQSAYVHHLRFANFGREPIRREDIAPANPLRIEVVGARTLDVDLVTSRREVSNLQLEELARSDKEHNALISFDFLDYHDGGVIRVLTSERPTAIRLVGDIIGMPEGIQRLEDIRLFRLPTWIGPAVGIAFMIWAIAFTGFIYRWVTGTWSHVWLLAVPFGVLIAAALIALAVSSIWPSPHPKFPRELRLPWQPAMYPPPPGYALSIEEYEELYEIEERRTRIH